MSESPIRARTDASLQFQLAILLVVAVVLGGGGVAYGFANLAVQLCALLLLAINRSSVLCFWLEAPSWLKLLCAASLLLPAIQLVPLPPALWMNLPGRELAVEGRTAVGAMGWYPLSLDPSRTLVSLVSLLTPLTVLTLAYSQSTNTLKNLCWLVVTLGLLSFLLGVPQVLFGRAILYPENPMPGVLFGTFANRNSAGIFLVSCLALATWLPIQARTGRARTIRTIIILMLLLAIGLTQSRSAIALSSVPLMLLAARFLVNPRNPRSKLRSLALIAIGALTAALALTALNSETRLANAFERFSQTEDARAQIWEDASYTSGQFWPAGSGMGTFDEVFQVYESVEHVTARRAGRAHNDYLEIAIEAGAPGVILTAAWLLALGWIVLGARHSRSSWSARSGCSILFVIALQSLLDYPLRNQAMLSVAALALVLALRRDNPRAENT